MAKYWGSEEDKWVDMWLLEKDQNVKNNIFTRHLYKPLKQMALGNILKMASHPYFGRNGYETVAEEVVSWIWEKAMPMLDSSKGRYYSYLTRSTQNRIYRILIEDNQPTQSLDFEVVDEPHTTKILDDDNIDVIVKELKRIKHKLMERRSTVAPAIDVLIDVVKEKNPDVYNIQSKRQLLDLSIKKGNHATSMMSALKITRRSYKQLKRRIEA